MRNYKINRLKHKGQLGTYNEKMDDNGFAITDQNGMPSFEFKPKGEPIWYGEYKVAMSQEPYSNEPISVQTSRTIVIRHDTTINSGDIIKIETGYYRIVNIEPDDEVNGLDIVTLETYSSTTNNNSTPNENGDYGDEGYIH